MIPILEPFQFFTKQECENIIAEVQLQNEGQIGRIGTLTGSHKLDHRNNRIWWYDAYQHYDKIWDLLTNRSDYKVTWIEEPFQVSKYSVGEKYDWHKDAQENKRTSIRTLSMTCTLKPAPGAVFETKDRSFDLDTGWAVLFPADIDHRATSPSSGERWAFTAWGKCQKDLIDENTH